MSNQCFYLPSSLRSKMQKVFCIEMHISLTNENNIVHKAQNARHRTP